MQQPFRTFILNCKVPLKDFVDRVSRRRNIPSRRNELNKRWSTEYYIRPGCNYQEIDIAIECVE